MDDRQRIILAWKQSGQSQAWLARRAGISEKTVSRLIAGKPVERSTLEVVAAILAVPISPVEDVHSAVMVPVFLRDVAAGVWSAPLSEMESPDEFMPASSADLSRHGVHPGDAWVLSIRGQSMERKYPSGSRILMSKVRHGESDRSQLVLGRDYYLRRNDETETFKMLVDISADGLMTLAARNTKKYPVPLKVYFAEIVNAAVAVAKVSYAIEKV